MLKFLISFILLTLLSISHTYANEASYPIGSVYEIKNANSVEFQIDNPNICKIEKIK